MNPFQYQRATDVADAIQSMTPGCKFLAGGTNLVDLMKNGVEKPAALIDLNRVALAAIEPLPEGGLRLGAVARNSDTANHPAVRQRYPLLSQAILSGASPQTPQPGHQRGESPAADALPILYGYRISAMQ